MLGRVLNIAFVLLCISEFAFAQNDLPPSLPPPPSYDPVQIEATPVEAPESAPMGRLRWSGLKKLFLAGLLPVEQNLMGDWKMSAYADLDYAFASMKNCFSISECATSAMSPKILRFNTSLSSRSGIDNLLVDFLSWESIGSIRHSFSAHVDSNRQAAVASVNAADGSTQYYYTLDCRQLANDTNRLVCGLTLRVYASQRAHPNQARYNGKMAGFMILDRVR
jgi:hypothetical protein